MEPIVVVGVVLGTLVGGWLVISPIVFAYWFCKQELYFHTAYNTHGVIRGTFFSVALVLFLGIKELIFFIPYDWGKHGHTGQVVFEKTFAYGEIVVVLVSLLVGFILSEQIVRTVVLCGELKHLHRDVTIHFRIEERIAELKKCPDDYDNAGILTQKLEETREEICELKPESEACAWNKTDGLIMKVGGGSFPCSCGEKCRFLSFDDDNTIRYFSGIEKFLKSRIDELQDSESGE